jgi:MFS family permease
MFLQAGQTRAAQRAIFIIILMALSQNLVIMDFASANVSAAALARYWQAPPVVVQWVLSAGQLTLGAFLIVAGRLADRIGQRRGFIGGSLVFALGNLIAALGPSLLVVILGRALAGLGIALFSTSVLSLATRTLPYGRERTLALSMFGIFTSVGGAIGVIAGGAVVTHFGWRPVFLMTGGLGLANLIFAQITLQLTPPIDRQRGLDWAGAVLISLASGFLILSLMLVRLYGLQSWPTAGSLIVATLALLGFIKVESRVADPLVPLAVFAKPGYASALVVGMFAGIGAAGGTYLMSLFLQSDAGMKAQATGLYFIPKVLAGLALGAVLPRILAKTSPRWSLAVGLALQSLGYLMMASINPAAPALMAIISLIVFGLGNITWVVTITSEMTRVFPQEQQGLASGLLIMTSALSSSFSIALDAAMVQPVHPGGAANGVAGFLTAACVSIIGMSLAALRADVPSEMPRLASA